MSFVVHNGSTGRMGMRASVGPSSNLGLARVGAAQRVRDNLVWRCVRGLVCRNS